MPANRPRTRCADAYRALKTVGAYVFECKPSLGRIVLRLMNALRLEMLKERARQVRRPQLSRMTVALALLVANPTWTDKQIAAEVGCSVRSLYRWERYVQAREMLAGGKSKYSPKRNEGEV